MDEHTHLAPRPKSLADILAEELDGELGSEQTQELPVVEKQARLKAVYERIHQEQPARSALCLSGGGIRSAIFGLGILQGLAKTRLLGAFDYLSTVSGGGYVGGWLTAWIKNHPRGADGVLEELQRHPDSTLNPEPQPIRHLRTFSNYLTPKTGLTSVDTWTLIATYVRNMFLNWMVLISWLAAAMMIPRLYLAAINLQPDWDAATDYTKYIQIVQFWNFWLNLLLAIGFVLIAVAMAYAIVDVPSTGNARLPQRRFLKFRQLPLMLAALVFAEWWALFRNVHGSEPFRPRDWLPKFVAFSVASYLSGGVLATVLLSFRKSKQKARPGRSTDSLLRLGTILLTAAFAGFCLWAIATRMFLEQPIQFTLRRDCEATPIPWSKQKIKIPARTDGVITQIERSYVTESPLGPARITEKDLDSLELKPNEKLPIQFTLKRDCEATPIPWSKQKIKIPAGTQVVVTQIDRRYTIETSLGPARITERDLDALELKPNKSLPDRFPMPAPAQNAVNYVCFAPALILAVLLLVNFLFTGLASWVSEDEDREWWGRSAAWILITVFGWILVNVIVLWGAQAISATPNRLDVFLGQVKANPAAKALLGAFGGITGVAGALLALRSKLSKKLGEKAGFQWLLVVVAVVFLVLLSVVISWVLVLIGSQPWAQNATAWLLGGKQDQITDPNSWRIQLFVVVFLTAVMLFFGLVMGFFINVNKFSLHATYRSRLIRAFLGASRTRETRKPHLFTGFDPADNFALRELSAGKPFHVINAALNLIKGEELAWQERKAESFTMSRLHSGSWHVGYRPSAEYGDGITLGTALTISGAAANPNMGYHSSPVVGFLMTLFNLRLGWWLGNPGPNGTRTWRRSGPGYAVGPLFSEAIGNTNDRYKYVNLSDGGHFENLGLYEMVLRRCKLILVVDAGQDSDYVFEDLGNAIRKIRIDFGIPIDIKVVSPKKSEGTINHCAFGTINYSVLDGPGTDGSFIYIKPVVSGDEPPDVTNYAAAHPEFPHESTTDQWFGESQLESYRLLGLHAVEVICGNDWEPSTLPLFFEKVKKDLAAAKA